MTIGQWSKRLGISPETLRGRMKAGWEVDRILAPEKSHPAPGLICVHVNDAVVSMPMKLWLSILGVSKQAIHQGTKLHNRTQEEEILHRLKCKRDAVPPYVVKAVMEAYGKYQETLFTPEIRTLIRNNKDFVLKILAGVE